jgi:hypothetical protein
MIITIIIIITIITIIIIIIIIMIITIITITIIIIIIIIITITITIIIIIIGQLPFAERYDGFFIDYSLIPLLVQQNYIDAAKGGIFKHPQLNEVRRSVHIHIDISNM